MPLNLMEDDRVFKHFLPLEGRIHVVEVIREDGLYSAKAFLGPEFYIDRETKQKRVEYPVVATSVGCGYETLHDAFRSLRKDMAHDAWARSCIRARAQQAVDDAVKPEHRRCLANQLAGLA